MLELYLDTADTDQVKRFHACLPIKGITTNPTILAEAKCSLNGLLPNVSQILGAGARFHVQVVSLSVDAMVEEATRLHELPYDIVVKVPATETGLAAIKKIKALSIPVLATAIYSVHQGFLAALCGADYLAPYVNRIENMGENGINIVADLQLLIDRHALPSTLLPASFKSTRQVLDVLKIGVGAVTIPVDLAARMIENPWVDAAVEKFGQDWQNTFRDRLSSES